MNEAEDKKFYAHALTLELGEMLRKIYGLSRADKSIPALVKQLSDVACKNAVNNFFLGYLVELRDPNSNLTFAAVFNYHLHGRAMILPATSIGQPALPRHADRAITISYIAAAGNFETTDVDQKLLSGIGSNVCVNTRSVEEIRNRIADCNHHQSSLQGRIQCKRLFDSLSD